MKYLLSLCLLFVLNGIQQKSYAQVSQQDSLALVALYDSTDGATAQMVLTGLIILIG